MESPNVKRSTIVPMAELPQDMLMAILATLEIPDLVRAGTVCTSWRCAYTSLRSLGQYKPTQTPCLLYTPASAGDSVACLYSIAEKRSYRLALPEPPIRTRRLIGSSHGWLVTVDERSEMHLLNPITCEQIALPSVITIEHVKPIFDEYGAVHKYELSSNAGNNSASIFALDKLRDKLHYKALVFSEASTGSYIVALIHNPMRRLSFARVGDDKWTWLPPHEGYDDCTYKDGLLYAVTATGKLYAFDFSSGPVICITMEMVIRVRSMDEDDRGCMYILQPPWGDLLLIWRIFRDPDSEPDFAASVLSNTKEYKAYEFDSSGSKFKELNYLRGHVLFLGHYKSLCLSPDEYPSLKADHVYFAGDNFLCTCGKNNPDVMKIIKFDDDCIDETVSPQLWSKRLAPVWITPDLRKRNLASGGLRKNDRCFQ